MKNVWKIYMRSPWPQGLHIMEVWRRSSKVSDVVKVHNLLGEPIDEDEDTGAEFWPINDPKTPLPRHEVCKKRLCGLSVMFVGSMIGERRQHAQLSTIRLSSPGFLYLFVIISTLESKRLHSGEGLDGLLQSNLQIALCPCTSGAEWSIISWACTNNFSNSKST